jgi:hypothetical protein
MITAWITTRLPQSRRAGKRRASRLERLRGPIRMEEDVLGVNIDIMTPIDLGATWTSKIYIGPQAAGKRREVGPGRVRPGRQINRRHHIGAGDMITEVVGKRYRRGRAGIQVDAGPHHLLTIHGSLHRKGFIGAG